MKIECEICQTVFLIDDSLISDKGIKAQCPRCGHQTVVRRQMQEPQFAEPSASIGGQIEHNLFTGAQPAYQEPGSLSMGDLGQPMGMDAGYSGDFGGGDFGGGDFSSGLTCFKCGKPMHESGDSVLPVCEDCRADAPGGFADPVHDDLPTMGSIPGDLGSPMGAPSDGGGFGMDDGHYGNPFSNEPEPFPGEDGYAPSDYIPSNALPPSDMGGPYPPADDVNELLSSGEGRLDSSYIRIRRVSDGQEVGPISLADVRSLYVHGKLTFDDEYAGRDGMWMPIHQVPELLVILRRTPQLVTDGRSVGGGGGGGQGILLWVLAVLLLGGGGATAYLIWANTPKNGTKSDTRTPVPSKTADMFREKLKQWRRNFPSIKPNRKSSVTLTKSGWKSLSLDQPSSFTSALQEFSQAIVADPKNLKALAGYCLTTAWSPNRRESSARKQSECMRMLKQKIKRKPPLLLRSVYAIYLARQGSSAEAIKNAKYAARKSIKSAFPQLIYAEILADQQSGSKQVMLALKKAIKRDPNLARAHILLAKNEMKRHHYFRAEQSLLPLIKKEHPKGLFLMAKFHIAQGQYTKSAKVLSALLKKNAKHIRGWLLLAVLRYQFLGQSQSTYKMLQTPPELAPGTKLPRIIRKKRQLHMAYSAMNLGKLNEAEKHTEQLKKLDRSYIPGQLLQVQLLVAQKKLKRALVLGRTLKGKISAIRFQSYIDLLRIKNEKYDKAATNLRQLMDDQLQSVWPRLLLASVYLKQKKNNLALVILKKALEIEPDIALRRSQPTDYYFPVTPWREAMRGMLKNKMSRDERAIVAAAVGIGAYHLGRRSEALRLLQRSRRVDRNGLGSNLYIAQIYLDKGSYSRANAYAKRAYTNYDQNAVGALIMAWSAYRRKRYKSAKVLFQAVRKERPWYLSPKIGKALSLAALKEKDEAADILKKMLASQQKHHLLSYALYKLKW